MKLTMKRSKAPAPADVDVAGVDAAPDTAIADARTVASARLTAKVTTAAMIACLACAPVALILAASAALSTPGAAAGNQESTDDAVSSEAAAAGEYATEVVVAWLGATREDSARLEELLPSNLDPTVGAAGYATSNPAVASIELVDDVWSVTVGITVTDATAATTRRYFALPLLVDAGTVTVLALPTPVASPQVGPNARLDYDENVPSTSPLAAALAEFLGAYLTGVGDVSRYVTPGSTILPVTPAPYREVRITNVNADSDDLDLTAIPTDGSTVRVLVTATGVVDTTQQVDLELAVTMRARDGRWEVESIDPAPAWSPTDASSPEQGTPTPSSTPSNTPATPEEE